MYRLFYLLALVLSLNISSETSNSLNRVITDENGCSTKLNQIMKPEYPLTDHQGYATISFNIGNDGLIDNTEIKESMCVTKRDEEGLIIFKKCPFFINKTLIASKYIKYSPPINKDGEACKIFNHNHRFNFKLYTINEKENDFLLRNEFIKKLETNID